MGDDWVTKREQCIPLCGGALCLMIRRMPPSDVYSAGGTMPQWWLEFERKGERPLRMDTLADIGAEMSSIGCSIHLEFRHSPELVPDFSDMLGRLLGKGRVVTLPELFSSLAERAGADVSLWMPAIHGHDLALTAVSSEPGMVFVITSLVIDLQAWTVTRSQVTRLEG